MLCSGKPHLAVAIAGILAAQAAHAATVAAIATDEHMEVIGRDYGYQVDTNSSAMRIEATQLDRKSVV